MGAVPDFKDSSGNWVKNYRCSGKQVWTVGGMLFRNMQTRCNSKAFIKKNPTYDGCKISDEFNDLQMFIDWCHTQVGYGLSGYQLDKDILSKGCKLYSADTCVFVPQALNKFFLNHAAGRGEYPLGVYWHKHVEKFVAQINVNGKPKHVGYFTSIEEALEAYKQAKECEARRWHTRLMSGEFHVDMRVITALLSWKVE